MINKIFRKATKDDDLEKIAELIYYTDDYIYPFWFETVENCKKELSGLMLEDKFFYNYNNLYLAVDDEDNVLGLICAVDKGTDLSYDYSKLIKKNGRYKFTIENYVTKLIDEVEASAFAYISNVCVAKEYRGLHLGTFLLENLITYYKDKKFDEIALDVLVDNPGAIHLYEKMGFKKNSDIFDGFNGRSKNKPKVFSMNANIK